MPIFNIVYLSKYLDCSDDGDCPNNFLQCPTCMKCDEHECYGMYDLILVRLDVLISHHKE